MNSYLFLAAFALDASELEEAAQDATARVLVERLAQQLVHSLQLSREQGYEYSVDARVSGAELVEIDSMHAERLALLEGRHRRRSLSTGDEREHQALSTKLRMPPGSIGPTRDRALARLRRDRRLLSALQPTHSAGR